MEESDFWMYIQKIKIRKIPEKTHHKKKKNQYTREKKYYQKVNKEKNKLICLKYLADGTNIIRTCVLTSM